MSVGAEDGLVSYHASDIAVSTLTVAILFGCIGVVHVLVKVLVKEVNGTVSQGGDEKIIPALSWTKNSVLALTGEMVVFGAILGYMWVCENAPLFEHSTKEHAPDFFWFICLVVLMFAVMSLKQDVKSNEIINRDQTEEWKGWMQTVFLLYHYFHAAEVYNSVRIMISCYVWMTGFGNFSFFYIKSDFSFVRFVQMLWRLNFLVVFMCLAMNNMYMLYYICPLHTFYFLLVFCTMRCFHEINHSKMTIRLKLAIVGLLIYVVWEFSNVFDLVFLWLSNTPHPGAAVGAYGIQYEWHFRSGLDHYATFFGMIFALNYPQASLWIAKVEALPILQHVVIKSTVGMFFVCLLSWWVTNILLLPKLDFNSINAYTFMIPLLSYIYFRNCTAWLRQVHLGLLATIGKYTLETYLLQHHVWLTSNAKTLLVLVPGYPKVNLIVVTAIYFLAARRMYRATVSTRAMLVPNDASVAACYLGWLFGILGGAGMLAWLMQLMHFSWPLVAIAIFFIGVGCFVVVGNNIKMNSQVAPAMPWSKSLMTCLGGIAFASLTLAILPVIAPTGATMNVGPMRPTYSPNNSACRTFLGEGEWIDVDLQACARTNNAPGCRAQTWTWSNSKIEKMCGFRSITPKQGFDLIAGRTIAFVGDAVTYDIMGASHTLLDPSAGGTIVGNLEEDFVERTQISSPLYSKPAVTQFFHKETIEDISESFISQGLKSADVVVIGTWMNDVIQSTKPHTYLQALGSILKALENKPCIFLAPGAIFDNKLSREQQSMSLAKRAEKLNSEVMVKVETVLNKCIVVDLAALESSRQLDNVDGIRFGRITNEVIANIVLNGLQLVVSPVDPSLKVSESKQKGLQKGSGGGLAQSPFYGAIVLLLAGMMLLTMDNYGGIAFLVLKIIAPRSGIISWEEATNTLHRKIGVSKATYEQVAKSEDEESNSLECQDITDK